MINEGIRSPQLTRSRRIRARYVVPVLMALPILAAAAFAVVGLRAKPALAASAQSLGAVKLPFASGTILRATAVGGVEQKVVPVRVEGNEVWPVGKLPAGDTITLDVTIKRPGWISWLAGSTEQMHLTETTPTTEVASRFVTRRGHEPVRVRFTQPITSYSYTTESGAVKHGEIAVARSEIAIPETAAAGTVTVSAAVRNWEHMKSTTVSWFPGGSKASVVASPALGSTVTPSTEITLTFSKPVSKVLGHSLPTVSPAGSGSWQTINSHTIRFVPSGYGYGLGATVSIRLPDQVNFVDGRSGVNPVGTWTVPGGSTARLQQMLADLGYLPLTFTARSAVANTMAAQEAAAVNPPSGAYSWRYPHTPATLKALWQPNNWTELTKGAVMSFEEQNGMDVDGVAGPSVWKALIAAEVKGHKSTFGYTYVYVSEGSPETETTWHNGKVVVSGLVNTGIAGRTTATGTYAVFEHLPVTTMSGTNPDGTPYHDPGIKWVSYFNGGDALHEYVRASYGFPQSLGCVEMPDSEASQVYPYTPIGTIVNVVG